MAVPMPALPGNRKGEDGNAGYRKIPLRESARDDEAPLDADSPSDKLLPKDADSEDDEPGSVSCVPNGIPLRYYVLLIVTVGACLVGLAVVVALLTQIMLLASDEPSRGAPSKPSSRHRVPAPPSVPTPATPLSPAGPSGVTQPSKTAATTRTPVPTTSDPASLFNCDSPMKTFLENMDCGSLSKKLAVAPMTIRATEYNEANSDPDWISIWRVDCIVSSPITSGSVRLLADSIDVYEKKFDVSPLACPREAWTASLDEVLRIRVDYVHTIFSFKVYASGSLYGSASYKCVVFHSECNATIESSEFVTVSTKVDTTEVAYGHLNHRTRMLCEQTEGVLPNETYSVHWFLDNAQMTELDLVWLGTWLGDSVCQGNTKTRRFVTHGRYSCVARVTTRDSSPKVRSVLTVAPDAEDFGLYYCEIRPVSSGPVHQGMVRLAPALRQDKNGTTVTCRINMVPRAGTVMGIMTANGAKKWFVLVSYLTNGLKVRWYRENGGSMGYVVSGDGFEGDHVRFHSLNGVLAYTVNTRMDTSKHDFSCVVKPLGTRQFITTFWGNKTTTTRIEHFTQY